MPVHQIISMVKGIRTRRYLLREAHDKTSVHRGHICSFPLHVPLPFLWADSVTLHHAPYTLHPTPDTLHPTPYTIHTTPNTLHPAPYTLHYTPYNLHPAPYTLHPESTSAPAPSMF